MKRDEIDFFLIRDEHLSIHERLVNWARWVRVRPFGWQCSPMFRQAKSNSFQWHSPEPRMEVDMPDAVEIEKAVSLLPDKHRTALRWNYVVCGHPNRIARDLGVSKQALSDLVHDARTMLKNRTTRYTQTMYEPG